MRIVIALAVAYAGVLMAAWAFQARFLYFPDARRITPAAAGLADIRDVALSADDGVSVVTWRAAPDEPGGPVILYLHGNASNIANRAPLLARFRSQGWGVAALSYRGYGGSGGRPSERANVADALSLYDALREEGVAASQIVVYGESLGSGVAVQLAASRDVAGVVLQAPYASVLDMARMRAPFLLPDLLLRDRYDSLAVIGDIDAPLLWLHGTADVVIPLRSGRRLFDAAAGPKTAHIVEGAGHNALFAETIFEQAIRPFVAALSQ